VLAFGTASSGVPAGWAATVSRPGVSFLPDLSDETAREIAVRVGALKRRGDVVVASLHWGSNWGYDISASQVRFARRLIDGGVDVVHGHSSHHPRPIELFRGKLIVYGCGDLINDYEGISGHEEVRDDLVVMYFPSIDAETGRVIEMEMMPMQLRGLSLHRAGPEDARWLCHTIDRISAPRGAPVVLDGDRMRLVPPVASPTPEP
jgi:poly-gamma-glutamate synthesis protein (capsule biosynthesis protein)